MVGWFSDVYLSRFYDINMETFCDNYRSYSVAVQGIERSTTSNFQDICIYPEGKFILYCWYWSMSCNCVTDPTYDNYVSLIFQYYIQVRRDQY